MRKAEIRKYYLEQKKRFNADEIKVLSEQIFNQFTDAFDLKANQKVHCFLSIPEKGEVDTQFFLDYFTKNNIRVFVPKVVEGKLIALEITEQTSFITNSWGIKEPADTEDACVNQFDLVITPLLYADKMGNRVGYGKGFYDKFFTEINSDATKVGVSFFPPNEEVEDFSEYDVPLDYLVTPTEVLSFTDFESKFTK